MHVENIQIWLSQFIDQNPYFSYENTLKAHEDKVKKEPTAINKIVKNSR